MKICIYGGAFDPVHLGHLYIADKTYEELQLDRIVFVPGGIPPWKNTYFKTQDRIKMLSMAISDNQRFGLDPFEVQNEGEVSYSYDTVEYFRKKYPGDEFYFLIGSDALATLDKWHRIEELSAMITFIAVEREGFVFADEEIKKLKSKYDLIYMKLPYLNISSTYIREALQKNMSYRYMLRDNVYEYIKGTK